MPGFAEELAACAAGPSRGLAQSASGAASGAASVTEGRADEGGNALSGQETGDEFACVALSSAGPPAAKEIGCGCASSVPVEERCAAAVDACAEPVAGQGVGLIVAA